MASLPQRLNLPVYRGDTVRWTFALWAVDDAPIDLAGVTAAASLQQGTATVPLVCTITGNLIEVFLSAAASAGLLVTATAWDLELTYPSGDVKTIVGGAMFVHADVTGAAAAA